MKTRREGRTVPLHPEAKAALAIWLLQLRRMRDVTPQTSVFQSRKGVNRPIRKVQAWRIPHEAVVANELTGTLGTHAMRETFAHRVYEKLGRDLVKTQRALGHANINSTVSYLSCADEEIHAAILAS
jgi:site-specific recombinase XerC